MKEWKNEFNSFNSWKGLLYHEWYKRIAMWQQSKSGGILIAPVEVSLDPINACQLSCSHCNASRYLDNPKMLGNDEIVDIVKFLSTFGVKAICFGGGGEPTLHPNLIKALNTSYMSFTENSIATNGIAFNDKLIDVATKTCRWIGVSVDSATPETYMAGRGKDMFNKTISNLELLAKNKEGCDIAYKFLLFEYNQHEIFDACKLAKSLGVKDFHVRPADLSHQGMHEKYKGKATPYNIDLIKEQFEKCHEIADDNFNVYTIVHKFNPDMTPNKNFDNCYASPCCLQICADGNCYLCPDTRYDERYKLGHWTEIEKFWGSEKHYDLVFNTGRKMCTTRCTFSPYNRQCQELFIKNQDPMCWRFI